MRNFFKHSREPTDGKQEQQGEAEAHVAHAAMVDESVSQGASPLDWKPTNHQLLIMIILSIISFMVALDACIVVTSISVSLSSLSQEVLGGGLD